MSEEILVESADGQKIWAMDDAPYGAWVEKQNGKFIAHVWMTEADGTKETLSRAPFDYLQLARQHCQEIIDIAKKAGVV